MWINIQQGRLTHALSFAPDGPVPLGGFVAPTASFSGEDVTGVAVEFHLSSRIETVSTLAAVLRGLKYSARNHCTNTQYQLVNQVQSSSIKFNQVQSSSLTRLMEGGYYWTWLTISLLINQLNLIITWYSIRNHCTNTQHQLVNQVQSSSITR